LVKTDNLTALLMNKFVRNEEEKKYEDTLHSAAQRAKYNIAAELGETPDDIDDKIVEIAGELIKQKLDRELRKSIAHLAQTLALACTVGENAEENNLQRLKKMAEEAAELEELKLAILTSAFEMADYEHIAEVVMTVGAGKAQGAAVCSAAGEEEDAEK